MSRYDWPQAPGADARTPGKDDANGRARHHARRLTGLRLADTLQALQAAADAAPRRPARAPGPPRPRAPATSDSLLWQPLGPAALLGGQAEGSPRVSGRVNALCVHPDGQRAYAASANGGVWATTDGGAHWRSVGGLAGTDTAGIVRPAHRNACAALHVIWRDAAAGGEIVFMGTGEPHWAHRGRPGDAEVGVGIFVATAPLASAPDDPWTREAANLVDDVVYGIASDPAGTTLVAATATGLYQRPAAPAAGAAWTAVAGTPFGTSGTPGTAPTICSAVLWTPGDPADAGPAAERRPARLWVWVQGGAHGGLWVRDEGQTNFAAVSLDAANSAFGFPSGRGVLGAVAQPTQVWLLADRGNGNAPGLFRVTHTRPMDGAPKALAVGGVPDVLRDSGWYNIALAVDPSNEHRVAVAGSYLGDYTDPADAALVTTPDAATRTYDASIVVDTVVADPTDAARLVYGTGPVVDQMIGMGVHPDVHALVYSNGGNTLWAGCDGGIYRSDRPLRPAGFYPRNVGLSISETNYIGGSAVFEGELVCGLQDNGIVSRLSSGVWRVRLVGDGGGIAVDPLQPPRWIGQYTNGTWYSHASPWNAGPLARGGHWAVAERDGSAFYSSAAVTTHVQGQAPAPVLPITQLLIGTRRLWYSGDWGANWVTLPTGTDPLPAAIAAPPAPAPVLDMAQDWLHEPVQMCRWQDPDTAWVLTDSTVHRYDRTPGSHHGGGAGTWAVARVLSKTAPPMPPAPKVPPAPPPDGKAKKAAPAPPAPVPAPPPADPLAPLRSAPTWTEIEPNAVPAAGTTPARSALYLGTVGHPTDAAVDTLWWHDGVSAWVPTGLRDRGNAGQPLPAPVTAIVVDPALPDEVWVGTTVGVVHGTRSAVARPPAGSVPWHWDWSPRLNGLPEAPVEDLQLFKDGSLRLLRAAIASRGVWELRLDTAIVSPLSYLRVHGGDMRHRATARLLLPDGVTERPWHASPDVRPRLAPTAAALPVPGATPWQRGAFGGQTERLRRFQSALRSRTGDPRIVGTGTWDGVFSEVLRDHGAPTVAVPAAPPMPAHARVQIDTSFWNTHFQGAHRSAEPWGPGTPTEADLLELTPDVPEGAATEAACTLPRRAWTVDVVVHHRGRMPRDGADVRATLLWWTDPSARHRIAFDEPERWATLTTAWAATVQAMLNGASGASAALPAGWHYAGSTNATRRLTLAGQTLDPLNAGVASFPLTLPRLPANRLVLLVAVVRAGGDLALTEMPLRDLVLTHPAVAVRAVRIG